MFTKSIAVDGCTLKGCRGKLALTFRTGSMEGKGLKS